MKVDGKVAIVTGGGGGIGGALVGELTTHGARVLVADLDAARAQAVADKFNSARPGAAVAAGADVSDTTAIRSLISLAERDFGPVDMYFANAGVLGTPGLEASDADWDRAIDVNLRAHIRAAQLLIPGWVERGEGYFVSTASAAGLLTQIGGATYAVTKHAAVGFAEWLSITYGDRGIRVSCLCPMGVNTELLYGGEKFRASARRRRYPGGHLRRRGAGARRGRPRRADRRRRRALLDPAARQRARHVPAEGIRLRPLAARDAPLPGFVAERQSMTIPYRSRSPHVPV